MSAVAQTVELPELRHIITDAAELTQRMADWKAKGFHVLSPAHQMTVFPPNYGVIATGMFIKTPPEAKECYSDGTLVKGTDRALTRTGIKKVEGLAGISWLPQASRRTDDRRIQNLWEYESWCGLLSYDGQPRTQKGTAEADLRDGSAQIGYWTKVDWDELLRTEPDERKHKINNWSFKRVQQARQFGLRLAESKSESAAVRAALGLKSSYTLDELQHPFIVIKVTYIPDYADADVRLLLADRATRGIASMYPHGATVHPFQQRALPPPSSTGTEDIEALLATPPREEEPVPAQQTGPTHPPAASGTAPAPQPQAPGPKPPTTEQIRAAVAESQAKPNAPVPGPPLTIPGNAVYVEIYFEKEHPKKDGGKFTKGTADLSDGRRVVTVYGKYRDRLKEARDSKTPLIIKHKVSDYRPRDGSDPELEVTALDDINAPQDVPLPGVDPAQPIKL